MYSKYVDNNIRYNISPKRIVYIIMEKFAREKTFFCGIYPYYARFLFPTRRQMRRTYSAHNNIWVIITGMAASAIKISNLHP